MADENVTVPSQTSPLEASIRDRIKQTQSLYSLNLMGPQSKAEEQNSARIEASTHSFTDLLDKSWDSNQVLTGLSDWLKREQLPVDPNFKPEDHINELQGSGIPVELHSGFMHTNSIDEFRQYKDDLMREQKDKELLGASGVRGLAATALTGMVDLDAPLVFMSGGVYAGPKVAAGMEKIGLAGTRVGEVATNAAIGAELTTYNAAANAGLRPTGDWRDIPGATLGGLVFGGIIGGITPLAKEGNASADALRSEFTDASETGFAGSRHPANDFDKSNLYSSTSMYAMNAAMSSEGSIGAASRSAEGLSGLNPSTANLMKDSKEYLRTTDWVNRTEFRDTPQGKAAHRYYDALVKTPLASDWDKLANSESTIAQAIAHKIFESPAGIVRNNRSAALLKDFYENNLLDVNRVGHSAYNEYAQQANKTWRDPEYHSSLRNEFDRQVMLELNSRYHDNASHPASTKPVKDMVDSIDKYSEKAVKYLQGSESETPVKGAETLQPKEGWFRQIWRGDKMRKIMAAHPKGEELVTDAIAKSYQRLYNFDPKDASLYAKAVVRRAMSKEEGIDTNLVSLMRDDGRQFLEQFLHDNGFSAEKVKNVIEGLLNRGAKRGQEGFTKSRLDIDLRDEIPGTPYKLLDLVDTDVQKVWSRYARGVAGASALARHGIQKTDKQYIKNAIREELNAKGDKSVPDILIDNLFSHFESGPIAGGVSRPTLMAIRMTNLATLNGLGLTQMAETGAIIGAVGIDAFKATAPAEIRAIFNGEKTPLVKEIEQWTGPVGDTHLLHDDQYAFDLARQDVAVGHELMRYLDGFLGKGQKLQGYVSGFYAVHSAQQRIAVVGMVQKLAKLMKNEIDSAEARRLYDIGLDANTSAKIQKYFKDTVSYDEKGNLASLNLEAWNPIDRENFRLALNRHTYQTVQRAMAGEQSMWWSQDAGALFTHLKGFTLTTIQKQALRNWNIADPAAKASVTYGLMTAATVVAARATLSGDPKKREPIQLMKGALGMSNFTGYIPMFTDPVASILGMDDMRFNHYGMTDVSTGVIPTPIAIPTLNRLAHIPGALFGLASGNYDKNDIYAMQATPIIGNAPLMLGVWQSMKEDAGKNKE